MTKVITTDIVKYFKLLPLLFQWDIVLKSNLNNDNYLKSLYHIFYLSIHRNIFFKNDLNFIHSSDFYINNTNIMFS